MSADLYAILHVERGASTRQIRSAYRRLARTFHPDHNAADDAAERFKAITEAYGVLSDSGRRAAYDRWGHMSAPPSATFVDDRDDLAFE
jgi:molecular chaperone DnaJ